MGLQNKHSDTPGATPNLVPGAVAVNAADELFYFRAEGRVQSIHLAQWRAAAPADGAFSGAPLVRTAEGPKWQPKLTPSSVVKGRVDVDHPTGQNAAGAPGVRILGAGSDVTYTPGTVLAERFFIASERVLMDRIGAFVRDQGVAGPMILGIFDADLRSVIQVRIEQPLMNAFNSVSVGFTLTRGFYYGVTWGASAMTYATVNAVRVQAGAYLAGNGALQFEARKRAGALDEPGGINFQNLSVQSDFESSPVSTRVTLMRWSTPIE
ncbi:hypothetical protein KIKIMORA_03980 [Brevundimonas phage vB_BpoS-Kikimora]|uniref:Uncharacterized protein n=1 Tax=Brevundimonas phage vB_BpoS-Kikimora TaxID=2948601 RepID=A0A9E7MTS2_9CAUD|nr:hypothetical protein KIKIMORA_03980 [Brevundimonas phage vB_BpoS-Kikimora]